MPNKISHDLSVKEARAALKDPRSSVRTVSGITTVKIFHRGRWLELGRCDQAGQCHTTIAETNEKAFYRDPVAYYRRLIRLGARVTPRYFYAIDSYTDG